MTRQQMLDAINLKIARTASTEYSNIRTHYYLPVMIGDILDFWDKEIKDFYKPEKDRVLTWYNPQPIYETISVWPAIFDSIIERWKTKREPLDKQSDDCISYIYSLL